MENAKWENEERKIVEGYTKECLYVEKSQKKNHIHKTQKNEWNEELEECSNW